MRNSERRIVNLLIRNIQHSLHELYMAAPTDFTAGQMYAYAECLEILQLCPALRKRFLRYPIEERFPLP